MLQLKPDWFDEWVITAEKPDKTYNSLWRLKEDAPEEIKEAFSEFMEEM